MFHSLQLWIQCNFIASIDDDVAKFSSISVFRVLFVVKIIFQVSDGNTYTHTCTGEEVVLVCSHFITHFYKVHFAINISNAHPLFPSIACSRARCIHVQLPQLLWERERKREKSFLSHDLLVHSICKINSLTFIATNESKTTRIQFVAIAASSQLLCVCRSRICACVPCVWGTRCRCLCLCVMDFIFLFSFVVRVWIAYILIHLILLITFNLMFWVQ